MPTAKRGQVEYGHFYVFLCYFKRLFPTYVKVSSGSLFNRPEIEDFSRDDKLTFPISQKIKGATAPPPLPPPPGSDATDVGSGSKTVSQH